MTHTCGIYVGWWAAVGPIIASWIEIAHINWQDFDWVLFVVVVILLDLNTYCLWLLTDGAYGIQIQRIKLCIFFEGIIKIPLASCSIQFRRRAFQHFNKTTKSRIESSFYCNDQSYQRLVEFFMNYFLFYSDWMYVLHTKAPCCFYLNIESIKAFIHFVLWWRLYLYVYGIHI